MIQPLPYDKIEVCYGHLDLHMNKLEEYLNTPDDSDFGYFVDVDLNYPSIMEEKQRIFHFVLKIKLFEKINRINIWKKKPRIYTKAKELISDWTVEKN